MAQPITVNGLTEDLLKLILGRLLPPEGLLVSPRALNNRSKYLQLRYRMGLMHERREDRAHEAAWRDCFANVDAAPALPEHPVWSPEAAADDLYSGVLCVPALPVTRVCKQWRRLLLHELYAKVVVCTTGESAPQSTEVLVLLSSWPDDDEGISYKTELAYLSELPSLKAAILVHVSALQHDEDEEDRPTLAMPAIPDSMRNLQHLAYINLDRHMESFPASVCLIDDVVDSITALTRLETLHLPDVIFDDGDDSAHVTRQLQRDLPHLRSLYLAHAFKGDLGCCAALTALTTLYISAVAVKCGGRSDVDAGTSGEPCKVDASPLSSLAALRHLSLSSHGGYPCDVSGAGTLTQLRSLELEGIEVLKDSAPQFAALSGLDSLRISTSSMENNVEDASIDERMVECLAAAAADKLPPLSLSVASCGDVAALATLTSLRSLSICMASDEPLPDQVQPQGIHRLSVLTALTSFTCINCILDDQGGCLALFAMARLRALRLCDSYLASPHVICGLTELRDLRMERLCCAGEDADEFIEEMRLPQTCPGLTSLQLPQFVCEAVERVAEVARLSELRELDLSSTEVTDAGLGELRTLQKLRALHLNGCRNVTAAGLRHLTGCRALQCLTVRVSDISKTAPEAVALERQGVLIDYGRDV